MQTRFDISTTVEDAEVNLLLSASRKSYMPHHWPQQRITSSDLEWPLSPLPSCLLLSAKPTFWQQLECF